MQGRVAKLSGHWRWSAIGQAISPGFEVNDIGFQRNSDWLIALGSLQYVEYRPSTLFRTWNVSISQLGAGWSYGGERRAAVGTMNVSGTFHNEWSAHGERGPRARVALDGGAARRPRAAAPRAHNVGDDIEHRCAQAEAAHAQRERIHRRWRGRATARRSVRTSTRGCPIALRIRLGPTFTSTSEPLQYVEHLDTAGASSGYIVARLRQRVASITARADIAFSRRITLQLYAQPLIGSARYNGFAEVVPPRAASMNARVRRLDSMDGDHRSVVRHTRRDRERRVPMGISSRLGAVRGVHTAARRRGRGPRVAAGTGDARALARAGEQRADGEVELLVGAVAHVRLTTPSCDGRAAAPTMPPR